MTAWCLKRIARRVWEPLALYYWNSKQNPVWSLYVTFNVSPGQLCCILICWVWNIEKVKWPLFSIASQLCWWVCYSQSTEGNWRRKRSLEKQRRHFEFPSIIHANCQPQFCTLPCVFFTSFHPIRTFLSNTAQSRNTHSPSPSADNLNLNWNKNTDPQSMQTCFSASGWIANALPGRSRSPQVVLNFRLHSQNSARISLVPDLVYPGYMWRLQYWTSDSWVKTACESR